MEEAERTIRAHKVSLINRKICEISGVKDVCSFDAKEILLETELGTLLIKGEELHISRLTLEKGEVDIEGKVDGFTYTDTAPTVGEKTQSLMARLFR